MMIYLHGMGVPHKIKGAENCGIIEMIDRDRNSPLRAMIEHTNAWFRDGTERHEMKISGKKFWFRNGQLCKDFCQENNKCAEFWKKTDEAQMHRSKELWNKVQRMRKEWEM